LPTPFHTIAPKPTCATPAPISQPMSAWELLVGMPK